MNDALAALAPHPSKRISELVAAIPGAIDLTVGAPRYGPPPAMRATLRELLEGDPESATTWDLYASSRGAPALRCAVSDLYSRTHGMAIDPDREVLVTHGAAQALWLAIFTATSAGDEVVLADPCYMLYAPIVTLLGRRPVYVPTLGAKGFALDLDAVDRALGPTARALVVNSPGNPTGAVCSRDELGALAELAAGRGALLVHDEVLDCFATGRSHVPARAVSPSGASMLVNSLSKRFGMTGWRVGWLVADGEFVDQAAKAHTFFTLAVNHVIQEASARALATPGVDAQVARQAHAIREDGAWFARALDELEGFPWSVTFPDGGFYLFIDVRKLSDRLCGPGPSPGERLASYLLDRCRIAVVPGIAFGEHGRDYVRVSFAGSRESLEEAVQRLRRLVTLM